MGKGRARVGGKGMSHIEQGHGTCGTRAGYVWGQGQVTYETRAEYV